MKKRGLSSRIMSVLLSLMMLLSLLPTAVLADESATKTYTKVTSADELVSGEYVMVANNGYAPGVLDGTWVTAVAVTAANDQVIDPTGGVWTLTVGKNGTILSDANGKAIAPKGGNNNGIKSGSYRWAVDFDATDGTFTFAGQVKLSYYAQKADKPEVAADMCARAEEALQGREKDEYLLLYSGLFIAYNIMTKPERGWEYAERCIGWSLRTNTLKKYRFSCDMVEALKYETRPEVSLSLPEEFPLYRPDGIYQVSELRNYFYQQAEELALRYDARNGNSGYMDRLKQLMSN